MKDIGSSIFKLELGLCGHSVNSHRLFRLLTLILVFGCFHMGKTDSGGADSSGGIFEQDVDELEKEVSEVFQNVTCLGGFLCDTDRVKPHGRCINQKWVCDHDIDCYDRSDEPPSCPPITCSPSQFHCRITGHCIPLGYRCDREADCGITADGRLDSSDEDDEHCNINFTCNANMHKCITLDVCLALTLFCDGRADCKDGSDEGPFCRDSHDPPHDSKCKYGGASTYDQGYVCYCPPGSQHDKGSSECVDENECEWASLGRVPACEQLCENKDWKTLNVKDNPDQLGFSCSCLQEGYEPVNQTGCVALNEPVEKEPSILYVAPGYVYHVDMGANTVLGNMHEWGPRGFDYNHRNNEICMVDNHQVSGVPHWFVKCADILPNGTIANERKFTPEYSSRGVKQMAFDWVGNIWYMLDDVYDRVFVCGNNFSVCHSILSELEKPKEIAVDPGEGYLFITDWGTRNPGLIRLDMTGANKLVISGKGIIQPLGLTLDFPTKTVYWLDTYLEHIQAIDYNGRFVRRNVIVNKNLKSFYAIDLLDRWIYVADYFGSRIMKIDKFNGSNMIEVKHSNRLHRISDIRIYHRQRQPEVIGHPCAIKNGGCSHTCLVDYKRTPDRMKGKPAAKCVCQDGYKLGNDEKTCNSALQYPFLIFGKTLPGTISSLPLNSGNMPNYTVVRPIRNLERPAAIGYLIETGEIFFSDSGNFTISRKKVVTDSNSGTTSGSPTVVMHKGISNCEGLAIDWTSKTLYWSDQGLKTINVAVLSDTNIRKVIAENNMSNPRAVALKPTSGYVFWSDWSDSPEMSASGGDTEFGARIEMANVDGSERSVLVGVNLHWPNGLTVNGDWLYWCDAYLNRLERIKFDGSGRQDLSVGLYNHINHPYGIAVGGGKIYWSEYRHSLIMSLDMDNSGKTSNPVTLHRDSGPIFEIHIFDKDGQNETTKCGIKNGGCAQFCFFVDQKVRCDCQDGYIRDEKDSSQCLVDPDYSKKKNCMDTQFECTRNKRCIDKKHLCDGDDDCGDKSDEDSGPKGACKDHKCKADQFRCNDNICIPKDWKCDGDPDCRSGEDEAGDQCNSAEHCPHGKFYCKKSHRCILNEWVCDFEADCGPGDDSDEHENCEHPACTIGQYQCKNKQCINANFVCDGDKDCRDGSEEENCETECIQGLEFNCGAGQPCFPIQRKCDGVPDCADGSDEKQCPKQENKCLENEFYCTISGECKRSSYKCDGDVDCLDGSDEANCSGLFCGQDRWTCPDHSRCIYHKWRCDGHNDCLDGSDELDTNCVTIRQNPSRCVAPNFLCLNSTGTCLPPESVCNKVDDCPDGSDEGMACEQDWCSKMRLKTDACRHKCHNTPLGFTCSCRDGYNLQPDGISCETVNPCDKWGVCSQKCVPQGIHYYCDCENGYDLAADKFTCKSKEAEKPYIIFSNRHELRLVGLRDDVSTSLIVNLRNSIALDFYRIDNTSSWIFWTDIAADKIYRGLVVNQGLVDVKVIVEQGIATAEGIAVDWMGKNLYWVDSTLDQIEVAKLDGKWRATVVTGGKMKNPRALALDPREGLMFWTDWEEDNPRIERCRLSGAESGAVKIIFKVNEVLGGGWPNGLTADYDAKRIYWIDAKSDSIHTIKYDGSEHHEILRGHDFLSHPFALTLFQNHVYWTDWRVNSIVRANKWNGTDVKIIQGVSAQPFDIQVIHKSRQPTDLKNPCQHPEENGGCSHLCLIHNRTSAVCKCPYLMKLQSNGKNCSEIDTALLYAKESAIVGLETTPPFRNYMPVLVNKFIKNVVALDLDAFRKKVYWIDKDLHTIFKANMDGSDIETLIDSDLHHPGGLAVDTVSGNVYFSSWNEAEAEISVTTINGEFRRAIIKNNKNVHRNSNGPAGILKQPSAIAVDPVYGYMYFVDKGYAVPTISRALMDGSDPISLPIDEKYRSHPRSFHFDTQSRRLYWVNDNKICFIQLQDHSISHSHVTIIELPTGLKPSLVSGNGTTLYYYQEDGGQVIGWMNLDLTTNVAQTESSWQMKLFKNVTIKTVNTSVYFIKIMDTVLQTGENKCSGSEANCPQLCLPTPNQEKICTCATGFELRGNQCKGVDNFLLLAEESRIRGVFNESDILPPISQVFRPVSLDYEAKQERLFWVEGKLNQIISINRDLTNRSVVVTGSYAKLTCVAVDWMTGNLYWTSKTKGRGATSGVIEVGRLDGKHRYIVAEEPNDVPRQVAVDPMQGLLFWMNSTALVKAKLDGSDKTIFVVGRFLSAFSLDVKNKIACWIDHHDNLQSVGQVLCKDYSLSTSSSFNFTTYNKASFNYTAIALNDDSVYLFRTMLNNNSIVRAQRLDGKSIAEKDFHYMAIQMDKDSSVTDLRYLNQETQSGTNPCAMSNGGCEELCLFKGIEYVCKCSFGEPGPDKKTCIPPKAFLAYSESREISFAGVSEEKDPNLPYNSISSNVKNVVGMAADAESGRLYFSDIQQGHIATVFFNGSGYSVVAAGLGSLEGLAFDHHHHDLYWTSYTNASIGRAHIPPGTTFPVKTYTVTRLGPNGKPRGIAVDPCEMRVYWTNWNEGAPCIQRAYYSGAGKETIISTDIRTPNALAMDLHARKLYWSDARLDKIERTELDGTNRVVLLSGQADHPFGLAVHRSHIYWTDWIRRGVVRVNKFTGGDLTFIKTNFTRQPMGIVAVTKDPHVCGDDACSKLKSTLGCGDVCRLTAAGLPYCACMGSRVLNRDNRTCIEMMSSCLKSQFTCKNGDCIDYELSCDGTKQCQDGADEDPTLCANRKCKAGYVTCINGMCVMESKVCNGVNDCGDYSDETMNCPCNYKFRCNSGMCVATDKRCDHHPDCNDASDEFHCPNVRNCSLEVAGGEKMINCGHTTGCILPSWICDEHDDCWDNWDEANCTQGQTGIFGRTCGPGLFHCTSGGCIPAVKVCDSTQDCLDGSDEKGCKRRDECDPTYEYKCSQSSTCILAEQVCDGAKDCIEGDDETVDKCDGKPHDRNGRICETGKEFECVTSHRCIPKLWQCDGDKNCADGSDENSCDVKLNRIFCPAGYFECANGMCIPEFFKCNGHDDCGDNSDEPALSCSAFSCEDGNEKEFQCKNGACISAVLTCNGHGDCSDGSDEDPHYCLPDGETHCSDTSYKCVNDVCVNLTLVCDQQNDCGDWSDEIGCGVNECAIGSLCSHRCSDKVVGYECSCHPGYKLAEDQHNCVDVDECEEEFPCSQHCFNRPGSYVCSCNPGYNLGTDGKSCTHNAESAEPIILLANRYFIWMYSTSGHSKGPLVANLSNAIAVDYHADTGMVYWTDVTSLTSEIGRISKDRTNGTYEIIHNQTKNPDGIAVDWVGGNIYWCDKSSDTIEVSKLSGQYWKILIRGTPLQEPRALVLDPTESYLFWSDWGEIPHIGRMAMDGSNPILIVKNTLRWPNALTLDHVTKHIFWGDAGQDYIGMADYDGKHFRKLVTKDVQHIFSIAVFEDSIYWTDWDAKAVFKAHKHSGANKTVVISDLQKKPMGIKIMHPLLQPEFPKHRNPCHDNGWCSNLCLLNRNDPTELRTCECPESFRKEGLLGCVSDCKPSDFVCEHTYKCIPMWWRCDGQDDCGDWQDEMYRTERSCPQDKCAPGHYRCKDKYLLSTTKNGTSNVTCISPVKLCDGVLDCPLSDDEGINNGLLDCKTYQCLKQQYKCPNSSLCIPQYRVCDGSDDCPGKADERNCTRKQCSAGEFTCGTPKPSESQVKPRQVDSGLVKCINAAWVCDGAGDCPDGSDEDQDCSSRVVSCILETDFACADGRMCVAKTSVCDGIPNCEDRSDELLSFCSNRICGPNEFGCGSGKCIPNSWKCDGDADCKGKEDESDEVCRKECSESEFRCHGANNAGFHCVPTSMQCDGVNDCRDQSDEKDCTVVPLSCDPEFEFSCKDNMTCVEKTLLCNGQPDCFDKSDEHLCNTTHQPCLNIEFACKVGGTCISSDMRCNNVTDCLDGSDEDECFAECSVGQFQCANERCVLYEWKCNGIDDCGDNSDEADDLCKKTACPPQFRKCGNGQCYPYKLHCDGMHQCADKSDEDNCTQSCSFFCDNGHCIENKRTCDGLDDCGDNSDEKDCANSPCENFGTCSQKCTLAHRGHKSGETKFAEKGEATCHCGEGYRTDIRIPSGTEDVNPHELWTKYLFCKASLTNENAVVVLSGSQEIRQLVLHPLYHKVGTHQSPLKLPNRSAVGGIDFVNMGVHDVPFLYWTDSNNGSIYRRQLIRPREEHHRSKRDTSPQPQLIRRVPGSQPQDLTIDWYHSNLYWVDAAKKSVEMGSLDGRIKRTLINWNLQFPKSIAVAPEQGKIFWSDVGEFAKIESANLDGSNRVVLHDHSIVYPTSLVTDPNNNRIYWADLGLGTIETSLLNGKDRVIVKSMGFSDIWQPGEPPVLERAIFLDVFEDYIYFTTHPHQYVAKMSKFGNRRNPDDQLHKLINNRLTSSARILIWHPARRMISDLIVNPCQEDACFVDALCVPDPANKNKPLCLCKTGFIWHTTAKRCVLQHIFSVSSCPLKCANNGTCAVVGGHPICRCLPRYSGERCLSDTCSNRCLNGGTCLFDGPEVDEAGSVVCNCPLEFDGERCERYKCTGFCTKGLCYVEKFTGLPRCRCDQGYSGHRCEKKSDSCKDYCFNRGSCTRLKVNDHPVCDCGLISSSSGLEWTGRRCEHCRRPDGTLHQCYNGGYCTKGGTCACVKSRFSGANCEIDRCENYCTNGGTCHNDKDKIYCNCTTGYNGEKCQHDSCHNYCASGATCKRLQEGPICFCPVGKTGKQCQQSLDCNGYCFNRGQCDMEGGGPKCKCEPGYMGVRCEDVLPCRAFCRNGANCSLSEESSRPVCHCPVGLKGEMCEQLGAKTCTELVCLNEGECSVQSNSRPACSCPVGWTGLVCATPTCNGYCYHDGTCTLRDHYAICSCLDGYSGDRCQIRVLLDASDSMTGTVASIVIPLVVSIILGIIVLYMTIMRRKTGNSQFKHQRMGEEEEVQNNPVFLHGEDESMIPLQPPQQATNFSNPMYDSVYNDTVTTAPTDQEHHGLLARAKLEIREENA